jgi:PHD/YefM family antitoxin component YafN of YafNO toxin-antitoxin module
LGVIRAFGPLAWRHKVLKTTTVTELRSDLAGYLSRLDDGPVVVLSRSHPAAILVKPEFLDALLDCAELLEDLVDGRSAIADFIDNPNAAVNADEVFTRLGL